MNTLVKINNSGKLEIPAKLLKELGFRQGEEFVILKVGINNHQEMMILQKTQPIQLSEKKLDLELEYDPETNQYVAACPELDLATTGNSEEEAIDDLVEAMEEYAQDYLDRLELFISSPNRNLHFPLILSISACASKSDIRQLLAIPLKRNA